MGIRIWDLGCEALVAQLDTDLFLDIHRIARVEAIL